MKWTQQELATVKEWIGEQDTAIEELGESEVYTRSDGLKVIVNAESGSKIVVPEARRKALIWNMHVNLRHLGHTNVITALKKKYIWKGMQADANK